MENCLSLVHLKNLEANTANWANVAKFSWFYSRHSLIRKIRVKDF